MQFWWEGKFNLEVVWSCSGNCFTVNGLRDQLDDLKRRNQNSHISNEKNIHLQKQVRHWQMQCFKGAHCCKETLLSTYGNTSSSSSLAYGIFSFFSLVSSCGLQLEEANTLLRAESEAATRLRKTQTESSKQLQQLEANVRELQDKCCLLERSKLSLEKECISLQAALETERREHSQGSETISDLMGRWQSNSIYHCNWKGFCSNGLII